MNVVDSSAWLEYLANGPSARFFAGAIEGTCELVVPSITLFEVYERVSTQAGTAQANLNVRAMQQGLVVDLDRSLALDAARISLELRLPMADSIILATALRHNATLWTQDAHFADIKGVRYYPKCQAPPAGDDA